MTLVVATREGLHCPRGGFHVDPAHPVPLAIVTHARLEPWPLAARTISVTGGQAYGERLTLGETAVSLHPSGHALGSSQVRIEAGGETWVVSPVWKRAADPTCAPFEVVRCDTFVTGSAFALPIYRWDEGTETVRAILAWWRGNEARSSWLFCAEPGTAPRVLAELARLGVSRRALVHASLETTVRAHREAGVSLLPTEPIPAKGKLAGELVLAAATAREQAKPRGAETRSHREIMRVRGNRRRASFDRGFPLAEHADWKTTLDTIEETGARRVLTLGPHAETLARYLREERRLDARRLET